MRRLVECVPNFSEGRDKAKIDAIEAAIREVSGAYILDRTSDADHNRSVITLAGEPEAVRTAAVRAIGKAAELIDLTRQTGAHPRIGATDVVPFVPIEGVTLEDCVALARQAAGEIWQRYRIPVYLYEAAAQKPDRRNLENIRKGQFERLREEVLRNPDRAPDVGDAGLHPTAGATVVGARKFLIAYNINLDTPDVSIAKAIAKKIRFSGGGLPCVKAMGVDLRGRNLAQVSMNLTDFETTPVHQVFEIVKHEAESQGAGIVGSEIIGLIPRRAIEMTADYYLKVENFSPAMVFENRLEEALLEAEEKSHLNLAAKAKAFLDAVAAPTIAPGGGSVAALAGALGASLGQMVSGLSRAKRSLAPHADALAEALAEFQAASQWLAQAIDRDAASFEAVVAAHRLPKQTPEDTRRRDLAVQQAMMRAVEVPLEVARHAATVFEKLRQLESMCAPSMISDVRVGRMMAATAVRGALENVSTNLESITDTDFVKRARAERSSLSSRIAEDPTPVGP
jgi:glutamate formiminotransferase / formiminotetrahydrofolate cyclodeaminase